MMMKHSVLLALLAALAFVQSTLALKIGDRGNGWRVGEDKDGNPFCMFNGAFRIQGNVQEINSAKGGACPSPHPQITASGSKVTLGSGSVFSIKTKMGDQVIKAGRNYLSPVTKVADADYNTNVVLKVGGKPATFKFSPEDGSSIEEMTDCLHGLRLTTSGTNLNYDCASGQFRYDDEESSWNLIPV